MFIKRVYTLVGLINISKHFFHLKNLLKYFLKNYKNVLYFKRFLVIPQVNKKICKTINWLIIISKTFKRFFN